MGLHKFANAMSSSFLLCNTAAAAAERPQSVTLVLTPLDAGCDQIGRGTFCSRDVYKFADDVLRNWNAEYVPFAYCVGQQADSICKYNMITLLWHVQYAVLWDLQL